MRKFLALAALVLGVAACQTEPEDLNVTMGGEIDAVVNVTIPETETRATGGTNSGVGVFGNNVLTDDNVTMRYIFQVYYKDNGIFIASSERLVRYSDTESVSFPVRLIPERDYQFVVWADVVTKDPAATQFSDVDNHYVTTDLQNITLVDNWVAMDESRDAFTATKEIVRFNGTQAIDIDLYRPFAKLRVVTTDVVAMANLGVTPYQATVKYTTPMRDSFNALTGKVGAATRNNVEHATFVIAPYTEDKKDANGDLVERTLFTDYFFADAADIVKFQMFVEEENGEDIVTRVFNTDINVKPNFLTTLKGAILTDGSDVNVEVKPGFGGTENPNINYNILTSGADVQNAILNGGSYMLGNDIYVSTPAPSTLAVTRSAAEGSATIDLNGYEIKFKEGASIAIPAGKSLTITDTHEDNSGTVVLEGTDGGFVNKGDLKIEGGNLQKGAVENQGGNIEIEGGNHVEDAVENKSGEVIITGNNIEENVVDGDVTNYYAELFKAFEGGGAYKLGASVKLEKPLKLNNGTTLELTIPEGVELSIVDTTSKNFQLIDNRGTLTLKGAGKITVEATINSGWNRYSAVIANNPGGNLTVEGVTLEHLGGTDMAYGIDNLTNGKGTYAVTTVNGATIKSTYRAARQFLNGIEATNELYVKAGSKLISDNYAIFFHDPNANANTGKLVVEEDAEVYNNVYLFVTAGSTEWPVEVSVAAGALKDEAEVISKNVPSGYAVSNENGIYTIIRVFAENFADNSWENIIYACQNNVVPETWNVGNEKEMTIGDSTYNIAIIGKNHDEYSDDSGKAPLTLQLADVYAKTAPMNNTATNATGWSGSAMRTTTMVEILSAMPSDVQNAIKAVDKETLKGDGSGLETTSDKLFLLSLMECYGSTFYSNGHEEGDKYTYYENKENRIMTSTWWLRGPGINNGNNNGIGFTQINMSGLMANGDASYKSGVVFGFCF